MSILAQAANILSLGVSFFTEGFKDLVKEGGKKLGVAIASRVAGTVGSIKEISGAWSNLSLNDLEIKLNAVEHYSPSELQQLGFPPNN